MFEQHVVLRIDHDLALALKAPFLEPTRPGRTTNFRTAEFDLDSL